MNVTVKETDNQMTDMLSLYNPKGIEGFRISSVIGAYKKRAFGKINIGVVDEDTTNVFVITTDFQLRCKSKESFEVLGVFTTGLNDTPIVIIEPKETVTLVRRNLPEVSIIINDDRLDNTFDSKEILAKIGIRVP